MKNNYFHPTFLTVLLFFMSFNEGISQSINHWEMVVATSDTWHYYPGSTEPPSNWFNTSFNESSWLTGPGGIGYGDGDDETIINSTLSVYIRTSFYLTDTSNISWAILNVDYDDGFVAYFNGHEIARSNIGTVGIRPTYLTPATTDHEAVMYSGGMPESFIINKDTLKKYMVQGINVLALQVHNVSSSSSDLSSIVYLSVGIKKPGLTYRQVPSWFITPFTQKTNLPLLIIETRGQTIVTDPKITAYLKIVNNGPGNQNGFLDDATDYEGDMGIEIHGQSSTMFPKLCYGIELRNKVGEDTSVSVLGMPEEADWILSAPYSDKSMLRNAITYQLGSKMGTWQPRYSWCEVFLNGSYNGVYMLIEKIKRGSDRVDINKLKPDEISGDNLTGGYIIKVDKIQDLTFDEYFYTHPTNTYNNARNYAFTYVYPKYDEIVTQQKTYIQDYLLTLENTLNGASFKDPVVGYRKYMDANSFIDFELINELANNVDGYRYSTYFYKKKDSDGGKLYAGPLWDFDLCYGNVNYSATNLATDTWLYPNYGPYDYQPMHWWARLMEDPDYKNAVALRWSQLRAGAFRTDYILADLAAHIQYLGEAINRNFTRWPILGVYVWPNYFVGATYESEVNYLKTWMTSRLTWMDANLKATNGIEDNLYNGKAISVFPNPVIDNLNIQFTSENVYPVITEVSDMLGRVVYQTEYLPEISGNQIIQLNIRDLNAGTYILRLQQYDKVFCIRKLIKSN